MTIKMATSKMRTENSIKLLRMTERRLEKTFAFVLQRC